MKRLLYFTDPHCTTRKPSSRKDDYYGSIMRKFRHIDRISREYKVDMILCGGDLTHVPNESYTVANDLMDFLSTTWIDWKTLIGKTHDYSGNLSVGFPKSIMSILSKAGVLEAVGETYEFKLEDVKFFASHQTICPTPFFGHHILYEDLKTDANVVLISHLHMPFGITQCNGKTFVSPGSVGRNAADNFNIGRTPQCALIECNLDEFKIEFIPLECDQDVWDEKHILRKEDLKSMKTMRSMDEISAIIGNTDVVNLDSIIESLGKKYPKDVLDEVMRLKKEAQS